ncbi:MAG: ABC transporter permease [Desulfurococcaceae archaeon]|nr:ABC transporter permease [Desulfurococcaceae archaeon]
MKPVFYDFKRGVLRLSTMVVLVVFILAGVGLAYMTMALMATMPLPQNQVVYSHIDLRTGEFKLEVLLLDPDLKPVNGELEYKVGCYNTTRLMELNNMLSQGEITQEEYSRELQGLLRVIDEGRAKSSGGKVAVDKQLSITLTAEMACRLYINTTTIYGTITTDVSLTSGIQYVSRKFNGDSVQVLTQTPYKSEDVITSAVNETINLPLVRPEEKVLGEVSVSLFALNTGKSILFISMYSYIDVEFNVYIEKLNASNVPTSISVNNLTEYFDYVGKAHRGVNKIDLDINLLDRDLSPVKQRLRVLLVFRSENTTLYVAPLSTIYPYQVGLATRRISQQLAGSTGIGLFHTFFPVVVLYLVYIYVAKPRAQGALEFVLARPITRREIYTTRYFAGILVITVVTVLFYTALLLGVYYFTGILLDLYPSLILFSGLLLSSLAFYSLCYLLSTLTSGTRYIVVSIILYVLFSFLWVLVVYLVIVALKGITIGLSEFITKTIYTSYYFNPLGVYQFMQYYYTVHTGISLVEDLLKDIVNPWLVGLSTAAWITIPVILGWLRFKKISLTG